MHPLHTTSLPAPVARYLAAANRFDAAGAADSFTPDAVVRDEHKAHVGRAAIARWVAQTSQAAQPHVTVVGAHTLGTTVKLTGRVAGNFPGSPLELDYEFQLQAGQIAQLTIR